MKINLESGQFLRNGYLNISASPPQVTDIPENTQVAMGNFRDLKPILGDSKAEEIIFNPPLNVIYPSDILDVIGHWRDYLEPEGLIKCNFIDNVRLGRIMHNQDLPLQDIHGLVFGQNYQFKCLMDSSVIKAIALNLNMQVESMSARDCLVSIELKKNA